jgi:nucleotide-binding universal stress UspA family protein
MLFPGLARSLPFHPFEPQTRKQGGGGPRRLHVRSVPTGYEKGAPMKTIKHILFPVDLTENSEKLVPYVITMAQKFDAEVHVLFVVRIFQYFTDIYVAPPSISVFENELVEGARRKMDEFAATHFGSLPQTKNNVLLGDPSDMILSYIDEHQMDLVIMGTHGRKGLDRVLFGSVAERVIKNSHIPVLVINPYKTE